MLMKGYKKTLIHPNMAPGSVHAAGDATSKVFRFQHKQILLDALGSTHNYFSNSERHGSAIISKTAIVRQYIDSIVTDKPIDGIGELIRRLKADGNFPAQARPGTLSKSIHSVGNVLGASFQRMGYEPLYVLRTTGELVPSHNSYSVRENPVDPLAGHETPSSISHIDLLVPIILNNDFLRSELLLHFTSDDKLKQILIAALIQAAQDPWMAGYHEWYLDTLKNLVGPIIAHTVFDKLGKNQ
jgi:hypothetical protein